MAETPQVWRRMWKLRYSVPPEKGVWVWWIGPFLVGMAAGGVTTDTAWLFLAVLTAFLLRQPLVVAIRVKWRKKNPQDFAPATAWIALYAPPCLLAAWLLLRAGHTWVLPFAACGLPIFAYHLWLVREGEERQQPLLDLLAALVLALCAPAAYWCGGGSTPIVPWVAWLLTALQSTASIVHVLLRLEQRRLKEMPPWSTRLRRGALPIFHHAANVAVAGVCAQLGYVNAWAVAAFAVLLAEGAWAVAYPPIRATPMRLGMRQIGWSVVFVAMLCLGFRG